MAAFNPTATRVANGAGSGAISLRNDIFDPYEKFKK